MKISWEWLAAWLIAANLIAVFITVADKRRARRHKWRVPESTLWLVSVFGGTPLMLTTMHIIRHKTLHRRFMWGLPILLAIQIGIMIILLKNRAII